jgi:hypothetical protein
MKDTFANGLVWGIEIETIIPESSQVSVGNYHGAGGDFGAAFGAPKFQDVGWSVQRDGSIKTWKGYVAAEFVSPRLTGEAGLAHLVEMLNWLKANGAKVNKSGGIHVTIGLQSALPTQTDANHAPATAAYLLNLTRLVAANSKAIFAQTGNGRHAPLKGGIHYCPAWSRSHDDILARMVGFGDRLTLTNAASAIHGTPRGQINCLKAFRSLENACVEFRAFSASLDPAKVLLHVATCFGLVRKAAKQTGFVPSPYTIPQPATGQAAMAELRTALWTVDEVGHGLFGLLHKKKNAILRKAASMCKRWDDKFTASAV